MGIANNRGQCALETFLVLMVFTTFVLLIQQFAAQTKGFFTNAVLSKEVR
jgi:hypothetical protein